MGKGPDTLATLALAALIGCTSTPDPDAIIERHQHQADAAFEAGLYSDAIELYGQVSEARPLRKHNLVRAAYCYERTARPMPAIQLLEHVRDTVDRKDLTVLHRLADLYLGTGFLPEAADTFKAILAINPYDRKARAGLRAAIGHAHPPAAPVARVPAPEPPREPPAPSPVEGPAPSPIEGPAPSPVEGPAPSPVEGPAPSPEPRRGAKDAESDPSGLTAADRVEEGDRLMIEASDHARHLASQDLPDERASLMALRSIGNNASTLLAAAVHHYREAQKTVPTATVQNKIDMALQVRAFVDRVLDEIETRLAR